MNTLQLASYIRTGGVMRNIEELDLFDVILYDTLPVQDEDDEEIIESHIATFQLTQTGSAISGELLAYTEEYDRILVVLDKYSVDTLIPFFNQYSFQKKITVINIGAGVTGSSNKGNCELHDIRTMGYEGLHVTEPYDMRNFFDLLQQTGSVYIRLPDRDYASNIFSNTSEEILLSPIVNLTGYGFTGNEKTVLCAASQLLGSMKHCQAHVDAGHGYDLFCMNAYNFSLPSALISSIEKTGKLEVLVDHEAEYIEKCISSALYHAGKTDVEFSIITPDVDKVTANQPEWIIEQSS